MFPMPIRIRGMLRRWVLNSLRAGPKNGAEIINDIETLTFGWWRPSPGSIYPLLENLVKEGIVRKREDGRYELTEKGKSEVGYFFGFHFPRFGEPRTIDEMLNEINSYVQYMEDLAVSNKEVISEYKEKIKEIIAKLEKLVS
jgi:Predicted transcriptional regulators